MQIDYIALEIVYAQVMDDELAEPVGSIHCVLAAAQHDCNFDMVPEK